MPQVGKRPAEAWCTVRRFAGLARCASVAATRALFGRFAAGFSEPRARSTDAIFLSVGRQALTSYRCTLRNDSSSFRYATALRIMAGSTSDKVFGDQWTSETATRLSSLLLTKIGPGRIHHWYGGSPLQSTQRRQIQLSNDLHRKKEMVGIINQLHKAVFPVKSA